MSAFALNEYVTTGTRIILGGVDANILIEHPQCDVTNLKLTAVAVDTSVFSTSGGLKSRFRCLDRTGGALLYSPEKVSQMIVCFMLHNTEQRHEMEHDAMDMEEEEEEEDDHDRI